MPAVSPTLLAVLTIGVVALILGILIGSYTMPPSLSEENQTKLNLIKQLSENQYLGRDDQIVKHIIEKVDNETLRQNLKFLSFEPHLPGSTRDEQLAAYIRDSFVEQGLDRAYLVPYKVLLSYSNSTHPNKVHIINGNNGNILFTSQHQEVPLRKDEMHPTFVHSYNSFAPKADVIGDPVFCNYGREKDFDLLEDYARIDLKGKICLIKYGKIFRGNKCTNAAMRGCIGVILYSDPLEMAREGTQPDNLYPNTWWMNGKAMQRGNIGNTMGDVLTPGFPALIDDGAFHYDPEDIQLPKIPSQPIGYEDALSILKIMGGNSIPNTPEFHDWNGALNITYRLGPGFNSQNHEKKLRLVVNNHLQRKIIYNVIGILEGSVETDRYVILGNHRDAWGFGAMDPISGTTALLEVTRVFGGLHKETKWRPRRTMVFASWTAEEFGLIGSCEWVEEYIHLLSQKAVAYINVDTCIKGSHFNPDASPALMQILREVTEYIPFKNDNTIYSSWIEHQETLYGFLDKPKINTLGSGTDHAPFAFFAGIPAINIEFTFDKQKYPISGYPAYHTGYETFNLVEKFIDPDFSLHKTCSQLLGVLMHAISGSSLLPFRIDELADRVQTDYENMWKEDKHRIISKSELTYGPNKASIELLETSIANFSIAAKEWKEYLKEIDLSNPYLVRQMNDIMMAVERSFIKTEGLHERPEIRNLLYAPFKYNKYSTVVFPGMLDLLKKIVQTQRSDATQVPEYWKLLRRHVSDIAIALKSAANLLKRSPL